MERPIVYFVFLLICIISRLITGINYIEDSQSLLVFTEISNSSLYELLTNLHHPIFGVLVKTIAYLTLNFSTSFSILGGISTFIIIYYIIRLIKVPLASLEGGLVSAVLFFNPLLWIASNRYTPEIEGTAIAIASFYYLMSTPKSRYQHLAGWVLAGVLGGFTFMLYPFLLLPLSLNGYSRKNIYKSILCLLGGILIWAGPALLQLGWQNFIVEIKYNLDVYSWTSLRWSQVGNLFKDVWAGGLGGFWPGRSLFTLITSIFLLPVLFFGVVILLSFEYPRKKLFTLWGAFLLYFLWLLFYKNTNNISVLILMPFFSVVISYGIIYFLVNFNMIAVKFAVLVFILCNVWGSIYLALDHKNLNAAAQLRMYLVSNIKNPETIIASEEMYKYLSLQGVQAKRFIADDSEKVIVSTKLISINDVYKSEKPSQTYVFSHNPFLSREWSYLYLMKYQ